MDYDKEEIFKTLNDKAMTYLDNLPTDKVVREVPEDNEINSNE